MPCLHNFCGGCYTEWMRHNNDCPICRKTVKNINKNALCASMVEDFLTTNPSKKRDAYYLEDLDIKDVFKSATDMVTLAKA